MKTKEELNELKKQYEELNEKCRELTPEELEQVTGGGSHCGIYLGDGQMAHTPQQV